MGELTLEQQRAIAMAQARLRISQQNSGGDYTVIATVKDGGKVVKPNGGGSLTYIAPGGGRTVTDPAFIERIMSGEDVQRVTQSQQDQMTISQNPVAARGNEFVRGTPFAGSYVDEAARFLAAPLIEGGKALGISGGDASNVTNAMRQTTEAMQRENPGQTMALNLAGSAASLPVASAMAGPTIAAASKAAPASKAAQIAIGGILGSLAGAGEGLVYGMGEGNDGNRLAEGGRQAGVGAAFGGVLGAGGAALGPFVERMIKRFKGEDVSAIAQQFGVSKDTAKVLKQAFQANDQTAVDRILRAGSEATLADAGRSGTALLDAAAQTGGRPLNIVSDAVTARANRSLPLANSALDDVLGPVRGPISAAREISEQSRPARTASYGAAYNTPIDYTTGNPSGARVLEVVDALPQNIRASVARQMADDIALDKLRGNPVPDAPLFNEMGERIGDMPTVMQLDYAKRALNQVANDNKDVFGRLTGQGNTASGFASEVRNATVDATGGANGTYAAALKVGGDKIEMDRALEYGLKMLRNSDQTTREATAEILRDMSTDGRAMMKAGVRSYLDELTARVGNIASDVDGMDARQAYSELKALSSESARGKLKLLLGESDFQRVIPKLDEAMASQGMKADVARNSATAIRQSTQKAVEDVTAQSALRKGNVPGAVQELTQVLLGTTADLTQARQEKIWTEIAQTLSQRRGSRSAEAALRYVEQAMQGQPLTEAQARLIASQALGASVPTLSRAGNQIQSLAQ